MDKKEFESFEASVQRGIEIITYLDDTLDMKYEVSHGPVSYTHLDVYKRQAWLMGGQFMAIQNYNELNSWELDALKEIGSIGTGNAATALSSMIGKQVRIEVPEVRIMGYNEAIEWIGGPEEITAGVLVRILSLIHI